MLGCSDDEPEIDEDADRALLEDVALTLDDLPDGFEEVEEESDADDAGDAFEACGDEVGLDSEEIEDNKVAVVGDELSFVLEDDESFTRVNASVSTLRDADLATSQLEAFEDDDFFDCVTEEIEEAISEDGALSEFTIDTIDPAVEGDAAAAVAIGLESGGIPFEMQMHMVLVDRFGFTVQVLAGPDGVDEDLVEDVLDAMIDRFEDAPGLTARGVSPVGLPPCRSRLAHHRLGCRPPVLPPRRRGRPCCGPQGGRRHGGRRPPGRRRRPARPQGRRRLMALGPDLWRLRGLQTDLEAAGLEVVDAYVSLTELSEYAAGVPEELRQARLFPQLPPEGKPAWCFYPMSKRRDPDQNWFTLPYDERKELMYEHGKSGRKFAGRVLQVVTGADRPRRLRVGRHAVRPAPRRPQGGRLHDAVRRGLGASTPSSARSSPAWSRRSTRSLDAIGA